MKHGFLIMLHNNLHQLKLLLRYLDEYNNVIILGVDKHFYNQEIENIIKGHIKKANTIRKKMPIYWGGVSQISATVDMLTEIERYNCDYIHFITNADVPLMTKEYFYRFFEEHDGMNFIEYAPENYEFAKFKCEYFHLFVENKFYRKCKILRGISHTIVELQKILRIKRKFETMYHGSAYFSIKNDLVSYIVRNKSFIKKYKYTLGADEVWLQTLVKNSIFINTVNEFEKPKANLRYIDWKRRNGSSPYVFRIADAEELRSVINTKYIFGRKFDENVDEKIIVEIYKYLEDGEKDD